MVVSEALHIYVVRNQVSLNKESLEDESLLPKTPCFAVNEDTQCLLHAQVLDIVGILDVSELLLRARRQLATT